MSLTTGNHIGPYEIVAPIGAGGMGEVFRARDTRLGRDVALKIVPALFASDPERLRRFEQEARAAAALNHPNILVVYDVGVDNGVPFVVSELLEGRTLREVLEAGPLPARKAIDYGVQMATGLAAAHAKGIVHRDLKPENLFVTRDGRVKILDFGLAKLADEVSADGSRATMAQTDPGTVVGTVGYMAPEQLRGEPTDARADIFSLGAVLYEMFCGARAFKGKTAVDTMSAILKEDPADFPPDVHATAPAIERIVRRCLEKDVDERFQSARDIVFALEALSTASGLRPALPADTAGPTPRRRGAARTAAIAIAAALVSGAAVYGAASRFGPHTTEPPTITQLTFRTGTVRGARFSPDGETVLYAAAWGGDPIRLYSTRPGNPESGTLNLPSADLVALSRTSGELGLVLNPRIESSFWTKGTLARAPLSGGAPRALDENVISADFTPDGSGFGAAVFDRAGSHQLEFPLGTVRVFEPNTISDVRLSPDGSQVAFISHPNGGDDGLVRVMGRSGEPRTLSGGWLSIGGLAWAPGGRELWFTATETGGLRALRAVTLDGKQRVLFRAPMRLQLEDVAPDGRVLLTGGTISSQIRFGSLREKTDRDLSWFDFETGLSLSADGTLVAFTESGEGAGSKYGIFVRPTNGDPAVRIADGDASAVSPDGKLVALRGYAEKALRLVPTGAGAPRTVDLSRFARVLGLSWSPDGRRLTMAARETGEKVRAYAIDAADGRITALTPAGTGGLLLSPDGRWLASGTPGSPKMLYDLRSKSLVPLKGGQPADGFAAWSRDSKAVYVKTTATDALQFFRIDIATGARTLIGTVGPADRSGVTEFGDSALAADLDHVAYAVVRQPTELYMIKIGG